MGAIYNNSGQVAAGGIATSEGILSGGGGGGVAEVADWASRGVGSDGDWITLTDTGAFFRYSSAVGEWVRPFVYSGTPTLHARVDGDVMPSTQGWTESTPGASTISTDGTHVTINAGSNSADNPALTFSPGSANHVDHFVTGRFHVLWAAGNSWAASHSRVIDIFTGSTSSSPTVACSLQVYSANNIGLMNWSSQVIGTQCDTALASTECYVEVYAKGSTVEVYHDHAAHPFTTVALASCPVSSAGPKYYIGDGTSTGRAAITVRDLRAGEF
tara:strand:- start:53692 stop:54507 length:816 start_codon:yes stop_codon:yes gene_type:complete